LIADSGVGVALLDRRAESVLFANPVMVAMLGSRGTAAEGLEPPADESGAGGVPGPEEALAAIALPRPLTAVMPGALATDCLSMADLTIASGAPTVMRVHCGGRAVQLTCRGLHVEDRSGVILLLSARRVLRPDDADWGEPGAVRVQPRHCDRGPLAGLSAQQLTVLRLIGMGLSTAEIAQQIFRTTKTVEWHRMTLGKRLGVKTRVDLARIAIEAGLTSADEPHPHG
jgi:DNA-binding CsgD family transcriptional regulator